VPPPGTADERGGENGSGEDEELYDESDGSGDGNGSQQALSHKSFVLDAVAGLPLNDSDVNAAGKTVATLTVPNGEWTPELVEDAEDNGRFALEEEAGNEGTYVVRIKDGPLPLGPYTVVLNIRNGEGTVYHRTITFSVAKTPPPFKAAPQVFPYITAPGRNELVVRWNELPKGAKWYQLYVGTSADSAAARSYGGHITMTQAANNADITDLEGDDVEGGLPDGTDYWVWVKPGNDEGEGAFSSPGTRKTSATLWRDFYKNDGPVKDEGKPENFYCWDSFYGSGKAGGDYYIITPPSADHPGGTLQYGIDDPGEIVYHVSTTSTHDPTITHKTTKSKWGEPLTGTEGYIIYRYAQTRSQNKSDGPRNYQGVYYYGLASMQTKGPADGVTTGPNKNPLGLVLCYFGNSYNIGQSRNPETTEFEPAVDRFTLKAAGYFIAYIATPWYRDYTTPRPKGWYLNQ
jgi:hypothetical protein